MNVSVSVCGTDAKGQPFIERVRTSNISRDGALVEAVRGQVKPGDVVVLRCEDQTSRFRVVWKQDADGGKTRRLGLVRVASGNRSEDAVMPMGEPDNYQHPRRQVRRQHPRYKCEIAAELRMKGEQIPMWVTSVNLSEGGCAVETVVAVPRMTDVKITMWLDEVKVWARGVVITSLYGFGTGIKFTSISRQDLECVRDYLKLTAAEISDRRAEAGAPAHQEMCEAVRFRPGLDNAGQPLRQGKFAICAPLTLPEREKILS
ncbi:MAG TPA: PilZ domain-containing protein [Terriglobales bacterium]|jgi:hypothetical protein|nr:PilZ domain-containing protein [Terriglobales bacterium]